MEALIKNLPAVTAYLQEREEVIAAVLFGSHAKGKPLPMSDVDLALLTTRQLTLLEMGFLITELEKLLREKVDLVMLNDLYKTKPEFAFEIVSTGRLLFCKKADIWTDYKRNTYLFYLDTQYLRDMFRRELKKRLDTGRFGVRGHAK